MQKRLDFLAKVWYNSYKCCKNTTVFNNYDEVALVDNDNKELQEYYESSFGMFSSRGWHYFLEDMEALRDSIDNVSSITDVDSLWFKKGQLDILQLIFERKKAFESAYEDIQNA
jgi:hypothetical protein